MLPPDVVSVLLWSVQDMQSRLHRTHQLISAVSPHRPLLWVSAQPHLKLVHPK